MRFPGISRYSMIKITELTGGQEKVSLFSEDFLTVGDSNGSKSTLPFTGRGLKSEHVKIFMQGGHIWVLNAANDPFVTLNGHPFFKKQAESGSILKIRDIELKIELVGADIEVPPNPSPAISKNTPPSSLAEASEREEVIHAPRKVKKEQKPKISLKDFDSPIEKGPFHEEKRKSWSSHLNVSPFRNVRLFSFLLMGFLLILSVVTVEAYLRATEKSDMEELLAAESLSDIAMALTYARFYHIAPEKHNWSDPEFIQNNLMAILPTGETSGVHLTSAGSFSNCGYILRIYTSNDLSRFLIIAHPTSSLFQWLITKAAILVDSNSMELKKVRDLKSLNRMLSTLNTFDGINVSLISDLIKNGETIPLAYLARSLKKPEFQPPRALAFLRPGAENLIYNAPRYHLFDDGLLKKTANFASMHTSSHEQAMLKAELEFLKQIPNLVLYTTDASSSTRESIQALKTIAPDVKFMLATLKYDTSGRLRSTKIVMDSEKEDNDFKFPSKKRDTPYVKQAASLPQSYIVADNIPLGSIVEPVEEEIALKEETPKKAPQEEENPLLTRLQKIATKRERALQQLYDKSARETVLYLQEPQQMDINRKLQQALAKKKKIEAKTKAELFDLAFDYSDTDPQVMQSYADQVGLGPLWKEVFDAQ